MLSSDFYYRTVLILVVKYEVLLSVKTVHVCDWSYTVTLPLLCGRSDLDEENPS